MKVSLIISTYNWPWALNLCLNSVMLQEDRPDEVIVADDGSGLDTKEIVDSYVSKSSIPIHHVWQEDKGFRVAASRNNAIRKSTGDLIIFVDHDMVLHPKFIADHKRFAKQGYFVNGSRVTTKKEVIAFMKSNNLLKVPTSNKYIRNPLNGVRLPFLNSIIKGKTHNEDGIRTANMSVWKKDLDTINGFDEIFEGWGHEDSDLACRLMNAGVKRQNVKFAVIGYHVYHNEEDKSISNERNWDLKNKRKDANRIRAEKGLY